MTLQTAFPRSYHLTIHSHDFSKFPIISYLCMTFHVSKTSAPSGGCPRSYSSPIASSVPAQCWGLHEPQVTSQRTEPYAVPSYSWENQDVDMFANCGKIPSLGFSQVKLDCALNLLLLQELPPQELVKRHS